MRRRGVWAPLLALAIGIAACSEDGGSHRVDAGDAGTPSGVDAFSEGIEVRVAVPATGRAYVNLATAAIVAPVADPVASLAWDLAFDGYDVFTNSGPSGDGLGGAFGPLDATSFQASAAPDVPFLESDETGGAFLDWYAYESAAHLLYSRFHTYAVRSGARTWKCQIESYYGDQNGAPTSALYQLRYAELTAAAVGDTTVVQIDATAGGPGGAATAPSGCLDLASGAILMLAPADAQASAAWDLCLRRDVISVNGEAGGPRGTAAADLDAAARAAETLPEVEARTAASEQARFAAVTAPAIAAVTLRGDHVVSAFERGGWLDVTTSPPRPVSATWLVVNASGERQFLVAFSELENATTSSAGTIVMHIKPVTR